MIRTYLYKLARSCMSTIHELDFAFIFFQLKQNLPRFLKIDPFPYPFILSWKEIPQDYIFLRHKAETSWQSHSFTYVFIVFSHYYTKCNLNYYIFKIFVLGNLHVIIYLCRYYKYQGDRMKIASEICHDVPIVAVTNMTVLKHQ